MIPGPVHQDSGEDNRRADFDHQLALALFHVALYRAATVITGIVSDHDDRAPGWAAAS